MLEDALLVWRLKCGHADALTKTYLAHKDRLLALATALAYDRAEAEDALHDVFVTLATSARTLRLRTNLRAFLSTCLVNRLRNRRRRLNRQVNDEALARLPDESGPGPDRAAMAADEAARIGQALQRLPEDQREVITLHLQSGLTFRTIAEELNLSINTVQSRYRYGLEKLRTLLKGEFTDETCRPDRKTGQGLFLAAE